LELAGKRNTVVVSVCVALVATSKSTGGTPIRRSRTQRAVKARVKSPLFQERKKLESILGASVEGRHGILLRSGGERREAARPLPGLAHGRQKLLPHRL
jgi:hypothetical protein